MHSVFTRKRAIRETPGRLLALAAAFLLAHGTCGAITEIRLAEITPEQGFRFHGPKYLYDPSTYREGVWRSTGIGDFNGDGLDDFASADYRARVRVIFGTHTPPSGTLEASELNGANGFEIRTFADNERLNDLSALGDINGDGFDDFGFSTTYNESFVVYGSDAPQPAVQQITEMYEDGRAFRVFTAGYGALSAAGDVNGDGMDDFLVGLPDDQHFRISAAYIVFGTESGFPQDLNYSEMLSGRGIVFQVCDFSEHYAGNDVAGIGDINGDGIDDIAISGAPRGYSLTHTGEVYVIYGSRDLVPANMCEEDLDGSKGFRIEGKYTGSSINRLTFLASSSDVTGDGISEFLSVVYSPIGKEGEAYLFVGGREFDFKLIEVGITERFVTFRGFPFESILANGAGDINLNGHFDILFGSPNLDNNTGNAIQLTDYVDTFSLVKLEEPNQHSGVLYSGESFSRTGQLPATSGDFNGDGLSDFLINAPYHRTTPEGSYAYLVYGHTEETSASYKAYLPTGETTIRGLGELASRERSSPESRFWLGYDGGHDGVSSASLQTVTIHRSADQVSNLRNKANVLWRTSSNRIEWSSARVMVKYIKKEVEGLREEDLILYHALTPDGPWTPCEDQVLDTKRDLVSGVVTELGYFALAAEPSGDVNMDDILDASDLTRFRFHIEHHDTVTTEVLARGDLSPALTGDDQITSGDLEVARERILGK